MYTSYIGKQFLQLYNEREGTQLSARAFFDEVFFPLFFDDDRHLMHVHGSSFFQQMPTKNISAGITKNEAKRLRLHESIKQGKISGSTFVGYAAESITAVSSGQVSSLTPEIDSEEIYASWIGAGLAISMSGAAILINEPEILIQLFQGWKYYRQFVSQIPNLKGNQIDTWNAYWICHVLSFDFDEDYPLDNLDIYPENNPGGLLAIPSQPWVKVIFSLAKLFPKQTLTANAFYFDKTNYSFGFVNLYLPVVEAIYQVRDHVFLNSSETSLNNNEIGKLQPFFNFRNACMLGTIGLKALEPQGLRAYMPKGTAKYAQGKDFKFLDDASFQQYNLFKIWIIAMLNKTELLELAAEVAKSLHTMKDERGKTTFATLAKEVREAKNLKTFIETLTTILEKGQGTASTFKSVVTQVLKMPSDNFPLFITLVRFEYQYQQHKA
jgi:hypothetical protein